MGTYLKFRLDEAQDAGLIQLDADGQLAIRTPDGLKAIWPSDDEGWACVCAGRGDDRNVSSTLRSNGVFFRLC